MVKIKLSRWGKKNNPFYRIIVTDKAKKTGNPLSTIGFWYPSKDEKSINKEEFDKWLKMGAKPTQSVLKLLENK